MPDPSTDWLLDLYEHAPCGFHSLDPNGIFLRINDTELEWLGYTREEVAGRMSLPDILTIEGRHTFAANFPRLKATDNLRDLELDFVRKDKTVFPVLVNATAVRDANGKFLMSRSVVFDLSNRKHAENRFRSILEASPEAILICNRDGLITLAGGQTESILGYQTSELAGVPLERLLPARVRSVHKRYFDEYFANPQIRPMGKGSRLSALHRDGSEVPVDISLSPVRTDGTLSALAMVRDLSEEEELHKTEGLYRSMVSAMGEGVVVQERNGEISTCNESAERILGLTAEQMMGRTSMDPRWQALHEDGSPFPGEDHPSMVTLRTGRPQSNVCMGVRKAKGILTWILINSEPIFYPGIKEPRAVVTTFTDITDRKRLEEDLLQSQKLEALGRLAGGVAHDFNNILGIILGHCDLMKEQSSNNDTGHLHASAIRKSAEHAAALTRQLLAFSRKQVMQMQTLDLNEVVRSSTEMLTRLIGENIELVVHLSPDLGHANADPVQIGQVVMNLVVNARDALPKGGRITVETANVELDAAYVGPRPDLKPGSYVMISVSDTGVGMDEATLARLFEPFFTTKKMGRGTGLGLSITYGIVRQTGGHIMVYSEPSVGSTFKVYLPRVEGKARRAMEAVTVESPDERSETILVVEDDKDLREMILAILSPCGYNLLSAASADEAIQVSDHHSGKIAIMVSDIVLGCGSGGVELSHKIKSGRPDIRVLFMSGYSESFVTDAPDSAEFLEKPFSAEQLRSRVLAILTTPSSDDGQPAR